MVLPRDGLKDGTGNPLHYDKVFYVGETTSISRGTRRENTSPTTRPARPIADTVEVMRKLIPTHVVFNGKVGALTGKNAMTAKVGETVLIVHSQANRDTRPHLIGGHGDYVWETGKFSNPPQTGSRPGSSAADPPERRSTRSAARHLRLRHPQPDRGRRTRRHRPLQGRRQLERRPDDPGEGAGGNPGSQDQLTNRDQ